jgi:uncharacterized membrane protein YeaQ/YmgE (transglycosylase-associated protein family)
MGFWSWIVLGGVAGWIATAATGVAEKRGCVFNIILGILGSIVGGWLFEHFGHGGMAGFTWWSLLVATVGAMLFLFIARLLGAGGRRRR